MKTTRSLGVGIIGASAGRGWAKDSHVPAVQHLSGLELVAVAAGNQEKSDTAARAFGARAAYGDARDLLSDPAVDIVAVCVKVPDHRALVLGALAAGKHVYCEWPLGRNVTETDEMTQAADAAGVRTAIGLQTRRNPTARRAHELLAAGAVGRVLSARVYSTTMAFGPVVEEAMAFGEQADNGVTLVTIQGAHTLDFAEDLLGDFTGMEVLATTQFPQVKIGPDARPQARTTPDHLLVQARLTTDGGALTVEVAGGRPPGATPFRLEITGETGELVLAGGAARGFQSGRLTLTVQGQPVAVDEGALAGLPEAAVNVAGVYAALRDDILHGDGGAPGFHQAARLARRVEAVLASAGWAG